MTQAPGAIAVLNAGSSSIKFALYEATPQETLLLRGQRSRASGLRRISRRSTPPAPALAERRWPDDQARPPRSPADPDARRASFCAGGRLLAFGHRVVHGGTDYATPVRIDPGSGGARQALPLAPLHQPHNLAPHRGDRRRLGRSRRSPASTRLSTARSRRSPTFALPRELLRRRHPPLRLPRPVLRFHRARAARGRARLRRRPGGSPISATAPACARCRPAAASPARWASPRSTACRWAPAAARSIPACCSI